MILTTITIITRNRPKVLKDCLDSLTKQVPNQGFKVVVVDNSLGDEETKQLVLSYRDSLSVSYFVESKVGIPFARNKAIKESKTPIIAFLDDDCIVQKNWLYSVELYFKFSKNASILVGRTFPKEKTISSLVEYWYYCRFFESNVIRNRDLVKLKSGLIIDFKNAAFRREIFSEHLFSSDTPFGDVGDEDIEIGMRLFKESKLRNKSIFFNRHMVVYHKYSESLYRLFYRNFWNGYSNFIIEREKGFHLKNAIHIFSNSFRSNIETYFVSRLQKVLVYFFIVVYPFFSRIGRLYSLFTLYFSRDILIPQRK